MFDCFISLVLMQGKGERRIKSLIKRRKNVVGMWQLRIVKNKWANYNVAVK